MGASHVIVGLGNPGEEYEATRHNVGFMVVDRIAERLGCAPIRDRKYGAAAARGRFRDHELLLVKPQGYMNLSGDPVRKAVSDAGLEQGSFLERLIVIHDDLDLPVGRLKVQTNRGAGGHNGIKSIIGSLGTQAFARVRVGIDKPPKGREGTVDWVLTRFSKADASVIAEAIERAADAVEVLVTDGYEAAARTANADVKNS